MSKAKTILISIIGIIIIILGIFYCLDKKLQKLYLEQQSLIFFDRNNEIISILPNKNGYYNQYSESLPDSISKLLAKKEDRFFYWHFGINPISSIRAGAYSLGIGSRKASSTITQQLTKILLGNELKRNFKNKAIESIYALALEIYHSKKDILNMYANSIYFGNQIQGINQASQTYFGASLDTLGTNQAIQLLASISNPAKNNPTRPANKSEAESLAKTLKLSIDTDNFTDYKAVKENLSNYSFSQKTYFEVSSLQTKDQKLFIGSLLNERIREIVQKNIDELSSKDANNAAVIVLKLPENELLAIIGSPNPYLEKEGYKINMALAPRPIGSTIKPFIYLKGFEKGLRPYTLVDDREYKYITAIGFPLYPKNFDYQYRGIINLHYALSNSLNVPSLKVLEYIGLDDFYKFLIQDLSFKPIQDLENYQLGIALGGLEMSLLDLCEYFSIFPNKGYLKDLSISSADIQNSGKQIADEKYIQLINKILNDRKTGIEQFGLKSDLNLFQTNYALKTGTSRDFKDSWIIGFTPDFLVGVWVGNADNTPTQSISGQIGAGKIWQETMELLLNSSYNKKTAFDFSLLKSFNDDQSIEYGLAGDNFEKIRQILLNQNTDLILNPHDGDILLLEKGMRIQLKAKQEVSWTINSKGVGSGIEILFSPEKTGKYTIQALTKKNQQESIDIFVTN